MFLHTSISNAENGFGGAFRGTFRRCAGRHGPDTRRRYGHARVGTASPGMGRVARSHLSDMTDDEQQIMTGEQVAALLQVSPRTIEEWRQTKVGPPFRRMGKHVRYLRREVLAWFEELGQDA